MSAFATAEHDELIDALVPAISGIVTRRSDESYDKARAVWNGRVDRRPSAIVQAADVKDVQKVVRFARNNNLPLSICGSGHHPSGFAVCDDGIVLSMSAFKDLSIDKATGIVRAGSGVLMGEFAEFLLENDRILTIGSHGSVGLAGLTLGGGMGLLMGRYGLLCDSLISIEIVTSDGNLTTASASENSDLFWALRGGGGNFGVAVSLTYQAQPLEPVIAGPAIHPVERTSEVLRFYRDFTADLPDSLTVFTIIQTSPMGFPVCMMVPCYTGDIPTGQHLVEPLKTFGPPVAEFIHPGPYTHLLDAVKNRDPYGDHYALHASALTELSDGLIDIISYYAASLTSPGSTIVVYHQHGAASRIPADATAYAGRRVSYFVGAFAGWQDANHETHLGWLNGFKAAIEPWSAELNCINLHTGEDGVGIKDAYGQNYDRLQEVKTKWDPTNLFRMNYNIPPLAVD